MPPCGDLLTLTAGGGIICIMPSDDIATEPWSSEETGVWSRAVAEKSVTRTEFSL